MRAGRGAGARPGRTAASGTSVRTSTVTSPRMPWARPTRATTSLTAPPRSPSSTPGHDGRDHAGQADRSAAAVDVDHVDPDRLAVGERLDHGAQGVGRPTGAADDAARGRRGGRAPRGGSRDAAACCAPARRQGGRRCRGRGAPGRRRARQPSACAVSSAPSTCADVSLPPGAPSSAASAGWSVAVPPAWSSGCADCSEAGAADSVADAVTDSVVGAAADSVVGAVADAVGRFGGRRGRPMPWPIRSSARSPVPWPIRSPMRCAARSPMRCAAPSGSCRGRGALGRLAARGLARLRLLPAPGRGRPLGAGVAQALPGRRLEDGALVGLLLGRAQRTLGAGLALELLPVAGHLEDRQHLLGGLGAHSEPVLRTLGVDLDVRGVHGGVVLADLLDRAAVALRAGVGDDDAVVRGADLAHALEADLDGHGCAVSCFVGGEAPPRRVGTGRRATRGRGGRGREGPRPPGTAHHSARSRTARRTRLCAAPSRLRARRPPFSRGRTRRRRR